MTGSWQTVLWWVAALTLVLSGSTLSTFLYRRSQRRVEVPVLTALALLPLLYFLLDQGAVVPGTYLRFTRDWGVPLGSLASAYVVGRCALSQKRKSRLRALLHDTTAALLAICLALGFVGVELGHPLDRLCVIALVDRSRSMDLVADADSRIQKELSVAELGMREHDSIGVLAFAHSAVLESPLRTRDQHSTPQSISLGRDATDIEQAIRRGLAELPADARGKLVLLSDGVATHGDARAATLSAVAARVPIDVVALDQTPTPNVRVVSLSGPASVSEGETWNLRAVVESSQQSRVRVHLLRDGQAVLEQLVTIPKGQDVLDLTEQAQGTGLRRYELRISAENPNDDGLSDDNSRSAFVRVRGAASALVIAEQPARAAPLVEALRSAEIEVSTADVYHVPQDVSEFARFDLVVLLDLPAHLLTPLQLQTLESYVRRLGGGLLLFGSDQTMGPGGYGKTPIEAISPVSFDLKQDRRRASLAEVIAIDYSGSMSADAGGKTKLELANEAAARSAALLSNADELGVVHVDSEVSWTRQLAAVDDEEAIAHAIRSVTPGGGGIYVDLALHAAYGALLGAQTNLKHVLLFADGADAERMERAPALAKDALRAGITTSVVSLGSGSDVPKLENLSRVGSGRFYLIEDANRLPAVFAQETILATRSALNEVDFAPGVRTRSGPLSGVDLHDMPRLHGYVVTLPKPRAQVFLDGPEQDPILATWSIGVGKAGAFTSDYGTRWGRDWTGWSGAAQIFAQLGRSLARTEDDRKVRLSAEASAGTLEVSADVVDERGALDSYRELAVHVTGDGGFVQTLPLEALGPGRYGAKYALERPGAYLVTAVDLTSGQLLASTGTELSASDELRPTGTDRAALEAIANETGGRVRDTLAGVFDERLGRRFAYDDLTSGLLWLCGALLLSMVGARRFALPDWLEARLQKKTRGRVAKPEQRHATSRLAQTLRRRRSLRGEKQPIAKAIASGAQPPAVPPAAPRPAAPPPERPSPPAPSGPEPTAERKPSAAEVLLARRRGRK
jgi:uncharacterized membrane protein